MTTIPASDTEDTRAYQDALAQGLLLVRRCNGCGEHHDYPRSYCPFCGSGDTGWTQSEGIAEVYSITVWRLKAGAMVPAFVTLPEGPTMLALIDGQDAEAVAIGDRVRFAGVKPGNALPLFARDTSPR